MGKRMATNDNQDARLSHARRRRGQPAQAANDKQNARLMVRQTVVDTLDDLKMNYPETSKGRADGLLEIRKHILK